MHFTNAFAAFLAVAVISASPLKQRTTATVLNDISVITTDVANLQAAISVFTGTEAQAAAIITAENNLSAELALATVDVDTTATFNTADSTRVTAAVTTLTPRYVTALGTLTAAEAIAVVGGFNAQFETSTSNLRTNTDAFFNALKAKVDAVEAAVVAADQVSIDAGFTAAIAAF